MIIMTPFLLCMVSCVVARPAMSIPKLPRRGSRTWRANRPDYSASVHRRVVRSSPARTNFNVLDFGAKGDNATDNTHAFTAALLAAHKAGGATVNVPTGIFKFKGSLTIPPGALFETIAVVVSFCYSITCCHCRCSAFWKL